MPKLIDTNVWLAPLTNDEARSVYESLFRNKRIEFADEPSGVEGSWLTLSSVDLASPKVWMDAYLAAFAKAGGYRLVTLDSAFQRYEGLDLLLLADE
jgi:predicted nucleic acid-binding protein